MGLLLLVLFMLLLLLYLGIKRAHVTLSLPQELLLLHGDLRALNSKVISNDPNLHTMANLSIPNVTKQCFPFITQELNREGKALSAINHEV